MPQLHFYVPEEIAKRIQEKARENKLSVSRYVAETMLRETASAWPEGYFEGVVGGWQGEALRRPEELPFEERASFE